MRILKLEMPGQLHSKAPGIDLDDPAVQTQLYRELDTLSGELSERIRAKASAYLPRGYTLFSRVSFEPLGNKVRVVLWIDDPAVSGLSGLLARRAWQLSVPIMAHIVREAVQERLQTIAVEVDEAKTTVSSFAPSRAWRNPVVIAVAAVLLATIYWLFVHAAIVTSLRHAAGG